MEDIGGMSDMEDLDLMDMDDTKVTEDIENMQCVDPVDKIADLTKVGTATTKDVQCADKIMDDGLHERHQKKIVNEHMKAPIVTDPTQEDEEEELDSDAEFMMEL